jgi:hypothetical protein
MSSSPLTNSSFSRWLKHVKTTNQDHIHIVGSMAMLSGELASSNCRPMLLRLKQEMQKLLQAEKAWITESRNTL